MNDTNKCYVIRCKYCRREFDDKASNWLLLIHYSIHEDDIKVGENFVRVKREAPNTSEEI